MKRALTLILVFAFLAALPVASVFPKQRNAPLPQERNRTLVGFLVKAELRNGAQITFPAPPSLSIPGAHSALEVPHNGPVARNKGKTLLVLYFKLQLTQCAQLDREVLVVRGKIAKQDQEENSEVYSYGGWWVEDAKYTLCRPPALSRPIIGPWINTFWDPVDVRPEAGELNLIYEIDSAAKNLVFTDGKVSIDVDELLKRH